MRKMSNLKWIDKLAWGLLEKSMDIYPTSSKESKDKDQEQCRSKKFNVQIPSYNEAYEYLWPHKCDMPAHDVHRPKLDWSQLIRKIWWRNQRKVFLWWFQTDIAGQIFRVCNISLEEKENKP